VLAFQCASFRQFTLDHKLVVPVASHIWCYQIALSVLSESAISTIRERYQYYQRALSVLSESAIRTIRERYTCYQRALSLKGSEMLRYHTPLPMQFTTRAPFLFRREWFKEDQYIRVDVSQRMVDAIDCMICVSGSDGAGKALMTKHLGAPRIGATAVKVGFQVEEIKVVTWTGTKTTRRAMPMNAMVKLLRHVNTPTAQKMSVDLNSLLDDICEGKIEAPIVAEQPPSFPVVQYGGPKELNIVQYVEPKQLNTQLFEVNPYNTSVAHTQDKLARAKAAAELQKEELSAFGRLNECKRSHELAEIECAAKKRRVDIDNEIAVFKAAFEVADELKQQDLKDALTKMIAEKIGCADYL